MKKRFTPAAARRPMRVVNRIVLGVLTASGAFAATATTGDVKLTGSANIQADLVEVDLRNDAQILTGNVQITQGPMSIESEAATVRASQTPRSRYTFERAVHIRSADADLRSDSATAAAQAGRIATAVAKGSPATFEQRRGTADKLVRGHANVIDYDVINGIVKLSDNVSFSYGGNEFRGDVVVYHIRDERVTVNPGGPNGGNNGRVNITIKPRAADKKATEVPAPASGDGT